MKFKTSIKILLIANIVVLFAGALIYLRYNKVRREEQHFLQESELFAQGFAEDGGLTKQEALEGMVLERHMMRDHRTSDADLDRLLFLINKEFAKEQSGQGMSFFGGAFTQRLVVTGNQKQKIGNLCLKIACEATDDSEREDALHTISLMQIKSASPYLVSLQNDRNPEIAKLARRTILRFNSANEAKK